MSGMAGIYYRDGRPADRMILERMAASLSHRGPDGVRFWIDGSVGMCHLMLHTTPESLHEQLPCADPHGRFVLTADARLDNRDELNDALGPREPDEADGDLLMRAYAKWGDACTESLQGDFAFAIWDHQQHAFYLARDQFGVRSFYYYLSDRLFAFATEVKALLCVDEIPKRLNETRVADYLGGTEIDPAATFYDGIVQLLPAHCMVVARDRMSQRRYWALQPARELRLKSNAEYAEGFRHHLTRAVSGHVHSAFPVGSLLSGGLDSSAVVCLGQREQAKQSGQPLHTFSALFDTLPACDERTFMHSVVAQGGVQAHYLTGDRLDPWADIDTMLWQQDGPFSSPFLFMRRALCALANAAGVRTLMDGYMGDVAVSHGMARLTELLRAGRWWAFATQIGALRESVYQHYPVSMRAMFIERGIRPLAPASVVQLARRWRRRGRANGPTHSPLLKHDFAGRLNLSERIMVSPSYALPPPRTAREEHLRYLSSSLYRGFEASDKATAAVQLSASHPFANTQLVEFCLAAPSEQKFDRGWTRLIFRRAMAGILPDAVQWRRDKSNHHPFLMWALFGEDNRQFVQDTLRQEAPRLGDFVNSDVLDAAYQRNANWDNQRSTESGRSTQDALRVWRVLLLGRWLAQTGLRT